MAKYVASAAPPSWRQVYARIGCRSRCPSFRRDENQAAPGWRSSQHGRAELQLECREDVLRRQVGAGLHDRVDVVTLKLIEHRLDDLAWRRVRDRGCGVALEPDHIVHAIARLLQKAPHLLVADRLIRR